MPTLLELQRAVYRGLVAAEEGFCAAHVVADRIVGEARLNVYRNTLIGNLTTALRLVYPAIHRLVGGPFFESAARLFIAAERLARRIRRRLPGIPRRLCAGGFAALPAGGYAARAGGQYGAPRR